MSTVDALDVIGFEFITPNWPYRFDASQIITFYPGSWQTGLFYRLDDCIDCNLVIFSRKTKEEGDLGPRQFCGLLGYGVGILGDQREIFTKLTVKVGKTGEDDDKIVAVFGKHQMIPECLLENRRSRGNTNDLVSVLHLLETHEAAVKFQKIGKDFTANEMYPSIQSIIEDYVVESWYHRPGEVETDEDEEDGSCSDEGDLLEWSCNITISLIFETDPNNPTYKENPLPIMQWGDLRKTMVDGKLPIYGNTKDKAIKHKRTDCAGDELHVNKKKKIG
jgi:hypothetical protein